jgi:hypothetical protein
VEFDRDVWEPDDSFFASRDYPPRKKPFEGIVAVTIS